MNDLYLNIETGDEASRNDVDPERGWPYAKPDEKARHQDGIIYRAADYRNIRRIVRVLHPGPNDVFYDIGCGKGRCVCMLATLPLRRVVGIELNPLLSAVARTNAERLRGKRTPIEIRCDDAATAELSEGTIYFMYNPFGTETMREVLGNIEWSVRENPRKITIVYYHAQLSEVLHACQWLKQVREFSTLTGYPVTFFVNRFPGS